MLREELLMAMEHFGGTWLTSPDIHRSLMRRILSLFPFYKRRAQRSQGGHPGCHCWQGRDLNQDIIFQSPGVYTMLRLYYEQMWGVAIITLNLQARKQKLPGGHMPKVVEQCCKASV